MDRLSEHKEASHEREHIEGYWSEQEERRILGFEKEEEYWSETEARETRHGSETAEPVGYKRRGWPINVATKEVDC